MRSIAMSMPGGNGKVESFVDLLHQKRNGLGLAVSVPHELDDDVPLGDGDDLLPAFRARSRVPSAGGL